MATIYLALYKGKGELVDKAIRFFTKGRYSHCELAIAKKDGFLSYSSSPRDNGVRCKFIKKFDRLKWDLVALENVTEQQILDYFQQTKGKKYDWLGAIGVCLGLSQNRNRYFCSEWCFNVIFGSDEGWRFSPNQLSALV
ncbi:Uncharacterised protein [Phocoenobacter uteri]|uniref:Enoyl-CoA hydratase n=1 Tax=Phocoenobacter uteri TaxID=146806 RepID=A0A379C9T7_9PAST|nr:enoyl-CoA hydratase [Phocoenobacter uteri]MDG6881060.1 enoyl-CoA hydratase [Phocoenobacter uteri]SUB59080.1 Uncharacterised protein [Phocoenobacter uteri]